MLTPDQIYRRALNRYPDFLRSLCTGEPFFPLTVFGAGLAKPKDFVTDRVGIEILRNKSKENMGYGYEITWEERSFRRLGTQRIPATVAFTKQDDYVGFLKKEAEVRQFQADHALLQEQCPELGPWAQAKPLKVVAHSGNWQGIVNVCLHLRDHPRPDCYLRELPVLVDTKFVENHRGILSELLPIAAPQTVGADTSSFEARFGFRAKQPLVRMRFLDNQLSLVYGISIDDFASPLDKFQRLPVAGNSVLIVENEMTFLTLPFLTGTIAIYGAGDAAALLTTVKWLHACRLFYWGDLDAHGFETLSHLRKQFPNLVSVLMDESTLAHHSGFAVRAAATRSKTELGLTQSEQALYNKLLENGTLLEQERVPNSFSGPRLIQAIGQHYRACSTSVSLSCQELPQ